MVAFVDSPDRLDMALVLIGIRSFSALAEPGKVLERAQEHACLLLPRMSIDDLASERCSTAVVDLVLHAALHVILAGGADDCFWMDPACLPTHVLPPTDAWRDRQPTRLQTSMVAGASVNGRRGEQWSTGLVSPSLQEPTGMGTDRFEHKSEGSPLKGAGDTGL